MKFSLSWLKEHLETDADLATIVETLTRIGLEVEGVENAAEKLAPFVVAEVVLLGVLVAFPSISLVLPALMKL